MRVATIVVCLFVAGTFAAFGFWWKANAQSGSTETQSRQSDQALQPADDETAPAPVAADDPPTSGSPVVVAGNGTDEPAARERQPACVSDEGRRLRDMLASSDDQVRREALLELGKRDDTDPKLLTDVLAEDPSPEIRAAAARGLARLKSQQALPQLLDALNDDDIKVRTWAITAINNAYPAVRFEYSAKASPERRRQWVREMRGIMVTLGILEEGAGR